MKSLFRLLAQFFNALKPERLPNPPETPMPSPAGMMDMISSVEEDEIDCEGAFELMHRYADLLASGRDAAALFPALKRHIEMCKDCREELEALLRAIQATDPRSAVNLPAQGNLTAADERRP